MMFVSQEYIAYSCKEMKNIENRLKKESYLLIEETEFYRYYKNNIGVKACIYLKY